jgi:Fic family protein
MYRKIEKRGRKEFHYLVESIRSNGGWKKIKVYLGSNLTGKQAEQEIAKKRKGLERRVMQYLKESDPLRSLITKQEEFELEQIRKAYQNLKAKADTFQMKEYSKWFGVQFTYDTSAIEGVTLSLLDTKMLLEDKIVPEGKSLREISEVRNHKEAFDYMLSYKGPLTTGLVLGLHRRLMHDILWKQAGVFRDVQVYISGTDKRLPRPGDVPKEMKRLMLWHGHNKRRYHPVIVAAYFHAAFESIHPFRDGNGRMGRLILNLMLERSGFPMIDIRFRDRLKYYEALQAYDMGNLKPLVRLIKGCLKESMKRMQYH